MKNKKTALVTGASSGIGAAIAIELCKKNIKVFAVGRSIKGLSSVKKQLPANKKTNFVSLPADITSRLGRQKILKESTKHRLDLLINNAAIGKSKGFVEHSNKEIQEIINTNLIAPIMLTKELIEKNAPSGPSFQIVFVSSLAGKMAFPNLSIYSATKFALEGLAESLQEEYKNSNIRVTVLRPGVTDSNFFSRAGMDDFYRSVKGTKALNSPKAVADIFVKNLRKLPLSITIGNDRYFLKILPFLTRKNRFKVLDLTNKL